ncbi:hypothetical protein [Bradyrhizobium sp. 180]|uniref:hypothetical protein n=1 Tax=unclassified Bradyrhizobium TaxID=2631580 RepID=UPI0031F878A0
MKYVDKRPYADPETPETAARKLVELAATIDPVQDGRIPIEKINAPFMYQHGSSGPEFGAGIKMAVERRLARTARERHLCAANQERDRQLRRPYN